MTHTLAAVVLPGRVSAIVRTNIKACVSICWYLGAIGFLLGHALFEHV